MLYIYQPGLEQDQNKPVWTWHIGEPIPVLTGMRTAAFQADNDELTMILDAMRATRTVDDWVNDNWKSFVTTESCYLVPLMKRVREVFNLGLLEAKQAVERCIPFMEIKKTQDTLNQMKRSHGIYTV